MTKKKSGTQKYEKLGRTLESIFESGYMNNSRVYKINFIRGVFFGLGAAIGGTLIIACILWILTLFSDIPLVGEIAKTVQEALTE